MTPTFTRLFIAQSKPRQLGGKQQQSTIDDTKTTTYCPQSTTTSWWGGNVSAVAVAAWWASVDSVLHHHGTSCTQHLLSTGCFIDSTGVVGVISVADVHLNKNISLESTWALHPLPYPRRRDTAADKHSHNYRDKTTWQLQPLAHSLTVRNHRQVEALSLPMSTTKLCNPTTEFLDHISFRNPWLSKFALTL